MNLNQSDLSTRNIGDFSKKNDLFKPKNEIEATFINKPTIRLKRTPIGGFKPTPDLLKNPPMGEISRFQRPLIAVPKVEYDSFLERNREIMNGLDQMKVFHFFNQGPFKLATDN